MPLCQNGLEANGIGSHFARPQPKVQEYCHCRAMKRVSQGSHSRHLLLELLLQTGGCFLEEGLRVPFPIPHQGLTFVCVQHSLRPSFPIPHQKFWLESIGRKHHMIFLPPGFCCLVTLFQPRRLRRWSAPWYSPCECREPGLFIQHLTRPFPSSI